MGALAAFVVGAVLAGCGSTAPTPIPSRVEPYPVGSCVLVTGPSDDPEVSASTCLPKTYRVLAVELGMRPLASCPPGTDANYFTGQRLNPQAVAFGATYCLQLVP